MSIYKGTTLIAGALPNAANQDLSNLSQTGQAVIDGKADTDLTNATDQAKILMGGMAMPSDKYINLTLGASGATYTAPANGWYNIARGVNTQGQYVDLVNNTTGFFVSMQRDTNNGMIRINTPVRKGDILQINYTAAGGGSYDFFRFFYAVGSESEAS